MNGDGGAWEVRGRRKERERKVERRKLKEGVKGRKHNKRGK